MANFEAFCWVISSSINILFVKSGPPDQLSFQELEKFSTYSLILDLALMS